MTNDHQTIHKSQLSRQSNQLYHHHHQYPTSYQQLSQSSIHQSMPFSQIPITTQLMHANTLLDMTLGNSLNTNNIINDKDTTITTTINNNNNNNNNNNKVINNIQKIHYQSIIY
ncbi:unnamed protein product [Schistosoma bovis]|nr:unnamed protein product [Schistosoma bovis]